MGILEDATQTRNSCSQRKCSGPSLGRPSRACHSAPEPAYEDAVENPTAQSERDRRTRNEQVKTAWKNHCQRVAAVGILCGDKPWQLCDQKAPSLMNLSLGTEGRRVFNSKNSTVNLDEISTRNLWDVRNKTFIRIHNIIFARYLFLTRKQQKGEPIEKFYGQLKELSENCDLGEKRDTFSSETFSLQTCKMKTSKKNFSKKQWNLIKP